MNYIQWKHDQNIVAGTTIRDKNAKEYGNLALHVGGNLDSVIENRKKLSEELAIQLNQWVFAKQSHSDHIVKINTQDQGRGRYPTKMQ